MEHPALPGNLAALRGVHPRLYVTTDRTTMLRRAAATTHAHLWRKLRQQAEDTVRKSPPAYYADPVIGQHWQRMVGDTMPLLAMAHIVSGEQTYLDGARRWALASCGYPTWGAEPDLPAGHQLFGLAIVYDWLFDRLDEAARQAIRQTLIERGHAMYDAAQSGGAHWGEWYLQNHLWVTMAGLAAAAAAIVDEHVEAISWLQLTREKFGATMKALGHDGASHEGVPYWGYGIEHLLKFMELARSLLGVDLYDTRWFRQTALYRLYLSLPRNSWRRANGPARVIGADAAEVAASADVSSYSNSVVDFADGPRNDWFGPDYSLRRLAGEYRDGYAQWLADELVKARVDWPVSSWLNILWYDPTVTATPPDDLPTLHHFDDLDIVIARSGWSGDESMVAFKAGPYLGHTGITSHDRDLGGGHVHPDANHVVVFGHGEWQLRDDGYGYKFTGQHNTLLIDGAGQLGEGQMWFDGAAVQRVRAAPSVTKVVATTRVDHIVGDATQAYPSASDLRRYVRRLLYVKPDVLIVVDDIQLDRPRALELRFFPEGRDAQRRADGAYLVPGRQSWLCLQPLTTDDATVDAMPVPIVALDGSVTDRLAFRIRTTRARWRHALAVSWSGSQVPAPPVAFEDADSAWRFRIGNRALTLDWPSGTVSIVE